MAIEKMTMPQLGESVTEGTISSWLISVGDTVQKYDPIAEVTTDKVTAEVPSSFEGKITEIVAKEGETIPVGETICYIEVEGSSAENKEETTEKPREKESEKPKDDSAKTRYSPAVLRLSQEHNIDLTKVVGTGAGGRITRKDITKIINSGGVKSETSVPDTKPKQESNVEKTPDSPKITESTPVSVSNGDKEIPLTSVRKAIASNMVRSKHEAPHAWTMVEVDATNLVNYRESVKASFREKEGINLTFFAFFVKAVAQALKEFPEVNSMWAGDKIVQKRDVNISIAVATDDALYVPVIKHADEKTIKGIAREISELAAKTRSGKLTSDDMAGGTFTVNNTGSFGSVQSMGIINYPQAAILQVETIVKRPVVINNMIAIRDMVNICLSLDHRVLDGLVCGRFLARIKEIIENISSETALY
ncbi:dihydrolipoamide acetyltransferase family protein [Priestia filamentosa]|uniref:Dihydrolipoamide acetyltransferase component of pyruvate dehydrogenase complex n=1 Tax=Priestia filamentosa TaxID=1402861 RepID=A0A1X7D183_9BACI|nr:dihydrolipoamide acetyltransferase family protein [Priestia filamentosa]AKO94069.1 branched-chain alpha-keto acid dehydrogenase subunit E2 [Priestia filamentosa]MDT3764327.1 dihydrolipoamide acetyltransferase family protein [Priestia filamentosa]OXS71212.1 branched-chain alpha-keto acid dehydrogenase subunit E2 [Priestia filamentosa]WRU94699.1 dihydrolipoamide acetyltransferase family protein [Priestia filamentosa]SMF06457.1 branched-chain alpha-keto acid dehydrogenase E2 component [Priesti